MAQVENRNIVVATIANGAAVSDHVNLRGEVLVGIRMPAVWDAANLTFQVSMDDVTYLDAYDILGAEVVVTVTAASTHIWVHPDDLAGWRWLIVRSGTAALPVDQTTGADPRLLELITRGVG